MGGPVANDLSVHLRNISTGPCEFNYIITYTGSVIMCVFCINVFIPTYFILFSSFSCTGILLPDSNI